MLKINSLWKLSLSVAGMLFLTSFFFSSCESDDLCDQEDLTPNLIVRFHDKENQKSLKKVDKLLIVGEDKTESLYPISSMDSVALPLKTIGNSTVYHFVQGASLDGKGNLVKGKVVKMTINYVPEQIFVSKACGYKVNFTDLKITIDNNSSWISSVKINKNIIKNENEAQVYLYH